MDLHDLDWSPSWFEHSIDEEMDAALRWELEHLDDDPSQAF